jgi:hypothetical protein
MKKIFLIAIIVIFSLPLLMAQANTINTTGKFGSQIFLSDVYGRAFENIYADVNGSPYFLADYKYATITLTDGRKYSNVKSKINLVEQELVFIAANGVEGYIGKGMVSTIAFSDTNKQGVKNYQFQTGFPKVDNQTNIHFYQVLVSGKATLLKSIVKSIGEHGNELSGEKSKDFMERENTYVLIGSDMKRLKKDKDFFITLMADQSGPIAQYLTTNKVNFKSEDQLIKLIEYYNSL